ncbi:MAG: TOBE domain-containing protein, partial [Deltaproteobacteria bacterium]|nr:TOBE domain-containing protein [Deltaproteobacteria bacterium]
EAFPSGQDFNSYDKGAAFEACEAFAVVRPEHIEICHPSRGEISGTIEDSIFQGKLVQYTLRVGNITLKAEAFNAGLRFEIGQKIGVCFDYNKLHIIKKGTEHGEQIGTERPPLVDSWKPKATEERIAPN